MVRTMVKKLLFHFNHNFDHYFFQYILWLQFLANENAVLVQQKSCQSNRSLEIYDIIYMIIISIITLSNNTYFDCSFWPMEMRMQRKSCQSNHSIAKEISIFNRAHKFFTNLDLSPRLCEKLTQMEPNLAEIIQVKTRFLMRVKCHTLSRL